MSADAPCGAVFRLAATALAVREGLAEILCHPVIAGLSGDAHGNAELVLAEVLNNIVEHAYDHGMGQINLRFHRKAGQLLFEVSDSGLPMPDNELPTGLAQPINSGADLPEGGFGWFLIRSLTENLIYRRIGARNHLSFQLNIEQ